ncbi:hypothetical protein B7494_g7416 [Chlorociboria aeruginascens]|nr:hypothetical protein B7494_g7416 [Chlorociboria aeruginascens]
MSLFGSSPDEPAPVAANSKSRNSLFDDDDVAEAPGSKSSLFAGDDDTPGSSPWGMPTLKKAVRGELIKSLLPATGVPDSYIDIFDNTLKDGNNVGGKISAEGVTKVLNAGNLRAEDRNRISSIIHPNTDLGRNEFNVLLALIGLAQEHEDVTLDGVDERRRNLPEPSLHNLITTSNAIPPINELAAKPPQRPITPQDTALEAPASVSPPKSRRMRKDSLEFPEADPWGSPAMHRNHNHDSNKSNGTSRIIIDGASEPVRTTSNFTTNSSGTNGTSNEPSAAPTPPTAGVWGSYDGVSNPPFSSSTGPTAGVNGNHLAADSTFIEKRRRGLARFSNALVRHPVLSQEQLVIMFLTVPTHQELAVWRKQATYSVQEEFVGKPLPPGLEDSLSPTLNELFETTRSGVRRSAEYYIALCNLTDRLAKRNEGLAADHLRISLSLQALTDASQDTYATDTNDVPLLNEGLNSTAKHLSNSQSLLEDEARAWDEGILEDLKRQRDALVSMRDMFDRRDRYDKDNIPYLERRIQSNETKLEGIRAKPEGLIKPGEVEKVTEAIIKDKESIVAQHARGVFIKECIRDELVYFQQSQYYVSRWNQDWAQERVKYSELQADNWKQLHEELESMPIGEIRHPCSSNAKIATFLVSFGDFTINLILLVTATNLQENDKMPPNSSQRALISQFMAISGIPERNAARYLKAAGWKLEQACDSTMPPTPLPGITYPDDVLTGRRVLLKDSTTMPKTIKPNFKANAVTNANRLTNSYFAATGAVPAGASPLAKEKDALAKLFEKYRDPKTDEADSVSVDGTMRYLVELGVNLENAESMVALEIVQAPALGEMTKMGFIDGWKVVGADTIAKQKAYISGQIKRLSSDMVLFKRVYRHTFICSKEKGQKALPLENACVYWQLLFSPPGPSWITGSTDWANLWITFLGKNWKKSVNKDMWNQTFEFFQKTMADETLSFWSEDGKRTIMSKRAAEDYENGATPLKGGERPEKIDLEDEVGEFEDEFEDEYESEDEILEAGVDGRPDAEREAEEKASGAMDVDQQTFIVGRNKLEPGQTLSPDLSTYEMLHTLSTPWPCLSFDIVKDGLGDDRKTYPATMYAVAGTQADSKREKENQLMIMKFSGLSRMEKDQEEDSSDEDDDDDEFADPILESTSIPLTSTTNRIRAHQTPASDSSRPPTTLTASMLEVGHVLIHDVTPHLSSFDTPGTIITPQQNKPLSTLRMHKSEGYAVDWSPLISTGKLVTGDNDGNIFVTTRTAGEGWAVDSRPLTGHTGSIEELQWSPSEKNVFASASSDGTIKVWDVRSKSRTAALSVQISDTDVNVMSWSRQTSHLLASGADDGVWAVWDLRQWKPNSSSTPGKPTPVASFNFHKEQITSVEWHPTDDSIVAVAAGDDTLTLWDLAVELDDEESRDTGGVTEVPPQLLFVHYMEKSLNKVGRASTNERVYTSPVLRRGDEDSYLTVPPGLPLFQIQPHFHVSMVHIYYEKDIVQDSFTFTFSANPALKFSFECPSTVPCSRNRQLKRRRALSDVDGDGNEGRKKRRLRLNLITSRLSRPFSQPATNIANRGVSKIVFWGKNNKALGRNVLRKAAIMNRVRIRMDAAKDFMRRQHDNRGTRALREIVVHKPRYHEMPLPPSPLGLSNYDALDLEDGLFDHEHCAEKSEVLYSDFNVMNPLSGDGDDYEYLDALDGISQQDLPDTPPAPPEQEIVEILREKERQGDSYFVHLGGQ